MHKPWRRQTAVVQDDQPPKRRTQSSSAELQPSGPQRRQRLLVKDRYRIVVMGALSKHEPTKPKTSKLFHYTTLTLTLPLLLTLLLTPIPTLTLYQSQPYSLTLISNSIPNPILNLIFLNLRLYHCFSVLSVQVLTIHGRDGCGGRGQDLYHLAPAVWTIRQRIQGYRRGASQRRLWARWSTGYPRHPRYIVFCHHAVITNTRPAAMSCVFWCLSTSYTGTFCSFSTFPPAYTTYVCTGYCA